MGMSWMKWLRVCVWVCAASLWGCGENPQQLFDTAQFEEKQGNHAHARQLYEKIIQMDPESPIAQTARERLSNLKE